MDAIKCLDTYALWEISRGNGKFLPFLNQIFIVNELTLIEFYGILLKEYNEATAEYWFQKYLPYAKPVPLSILIKAIKFKVQNVKKNLSFFDAVGYVFAQENVGVFVTGDKEFEKLSNVEFIRK